MKYCLLVFLMQIIIRIISYLAGNKEVDVFLAGASFPLMSFLSLTIMLLVAIRWSVAAEFSGATILLCNFVCIKFFIEPLESQVKYGQNQFLHSYVLSLVGLVASVKWGFLSRAIALVAYLINTTFMRMTDIREEIDESDQIAGHSGFLFLAALIGIEVFVF